MGKNFKKPEDAAEAFGVGKLTRHLFLCLGPDCCDRDDGEKTWDYLKRRMKDERGEPTQQLRPPITSGTETVSG